jgi:pimeloyl-ACP methyl ester carboxylesterase
VMKRRNLFSLISIVVALGDLPSSVRMVDTGSHRLQLRVAGRGTPTVVLESGAGGTIEDNWSKVWPKVAKFTQVVAYDRDGFGASEAGPKPRTGERIATELHTALGGAGLRPPYVMVGHSLGGPFVHIFAHRYPTEMAGMVFVDPTGEQAGDGNPLEWAKSHHGKRLNVMEEKLKKSTLSEEMQHWMRVMWAVSMKNREEILARAPEEMRDRWAALLERQLQGFTEDESMQNLANLSPTEQAAWTTLEQARAAWPLPDVPVALLISVKVRKNPLNTSEELALEEERTQIKVDESENWIAKFPKGRFIKTEKSGHHVPNDEPNLVIKAIGQFVREARK